MKRIIVKSDERSGEVLVRNLPETVCVDLSLLRGKHGGELQGKLDDTLLKPPIRSLFVINVLEL